MTIDLSAKEFRALLDILHMADVVLSGHRREPDQRSEQHRELIQRLYSEARQRGFERLIAHDTSTGRFGPTAEFEERTLAHAAITEFGDHLFWDELVTRLSARDASRRAGGFDRLSALSEQDRQSAEAPFRSRYVEEFAKHGIANLTVVESFGVPREEILVTSD